jgi:hypothetical protein
MNSTPRADSKDVNDDKIARWGRSRNEGYRKFRHGFIQPAPLFFTQDHHPLPLGDIYRGRSAFLVCSGPSLAKLAEERAPAAGMTPREWFQRGPLAQPGVLKMGLNNSVKTVRPNLHVSVDSPAHWIRSLWLDPLITKFVPICLASKYVFNSDEWKFMEVRVGDCPNVVYYKRNEHFQAKQFLWEDCFNWGMHSEKGGGRSVMLPAIRILYTLGIRKVYLLGCDFNMSATSHYHFEQDRNKGSINGNTSTYKKLDGWFKELRPLFEKEDFHVYNCNPQSGLKAFDFVSFDDALTELQAHMDFVDYAQERTKGLYDTKDEDKRNGVGK